GANGGTMGVAMLGTFTGVAPTAKALASLRRILAWKADQRQLTPYLSRFHASSGLLLRGISGHRDGPGATECPGDALYALLPRLRAEVHNLISGTTYVTSVSAASYGAAGVAPQSILAAFGANLADGAAAALTLPLPERLGGVTVRVIDNLNQEIVAPLFYVSPSQINLLLPPGLASGPATILVENGAAVAAGSLAIEPLAPALFTANSDGRGAPAALLFRLRADGSSAYEPVSRYDDVLRQYLPRQIEFGSASDQLFLVAFGTGMRSSTTLGSLGNVEARLGQTSLPVSFLGPAPGFVGIEQINIPLPASLRELAGRGETVFQIIIAGRATNPVTLSF
ncbi:MAG: N-acetylmuramoyl-L-alanine amidase, partial [Acidobacteriota bacterium]